MIVRAKRDTNYTTMSNIGLDDSRLSLKAKGMLAYLLSKPDHWQVSDRQLSTIGPDGRAAVQAALKELETFGYLERKRVREEDGTFTWQSTIFDEPRLGYPATDKPATVYPATENRAKVITVLVNPEVVNPVVVNDDDNARTRADAAVNKAWAENIPGTMTPILSEKLHDLTDECGAPSVVHGIVAAVESGARNFNYIAACARNHASGAEPPTRASPHRKGSASGQQTVRKSGYSDRSDEPRKKYSVDIVTGGRG